MCYDAPSNPSFVRIGIICPSRKSRVGEGSLIEKEPAARNPLRVFFNLFRAQSKERWGGAQREAGQVVDDARVGGTSGGLYSILEVDAVIRLLPITENCPACDSLFAKIPQRSITCKECKSRFLVKKKPFGGDIQGLIEASEFQRKKVYWDIWTETKEGGMPVQFVMDWVRAGKPITADLLWGLYNQWTLIHAGQGDLGLYRNIRYKMANFLKAEGRMKRSFGEFAHVNFLDLNGPQNSGSSTRPFDKSDGFLAPVPLKQMFKVAQKIGYDDDETRQAFIESVERIRLEIHPLQPDTAYKKCLAEYRRLMR
jgi:DNA-directed RNA polymerase subunit RPC12/RpoP